MPNNPHTDPKASEGREGLAEEFEERLNAFLESNVRCHGMSPWPWFPWLTVNAPAILAAIREREALVAEITDSEIGNTLRLACSYKPVGAGDGGTFVVSAPTVETMRAALWEFLSARAALAKASAALTSAPAAAPD